MRVIWISWLLCAAIPVSAAELLENGDFEGTFGENGMAENWADNSSWADLDVTYARETDDPHAGKVCQRITCSRLGSGAVQMIPTGRVPLRRGKVYRVRAWLRGDPVKVAVQLRQAAAPYTVYVEESITLGAKWREVAYFWTSNVADPKGRFMLRFTQVGSVLVDDVSVEEVGLEEAARLVPPPVLGDLLHNGDFDLGVANWLVSHGCDYWREAELSIEQTNDGPCLKMVVPDGIQSVLSSDTVPLRPGHPVRISCHVKAANPTLIHFSSNHCATQAEVKQDWQTLVALGTARFRPAPYEFVRFSVRGPATLWIDHVQLRQDGQTEDHERPHAAIIPNRHPLSLYHDGEKPILRLLSSARASVEFMWKVENFWGDVVLSGTWQANPGRQETAIPCAALQRGWFRASVSWKHKDAIFRNESTLSVLPPPERTSDVLESPFGAHFAVDPTGLRLARAVGVRWLRLHPPNHTKWRVVEPRKGEWNWRDEPIRIAREAGLELCGSLDRCPAWASSAPPGTPDTLFYTGTGAWLPRSWEEWENYVAKTVRRYRGDIHIWEVWNEPDLTNWLIPREGQTRAEAYVEMLSHTTPIVKREDPTALVIGGCIGGGLTEKSTAKKFADGIIAQGALDLMDTLSFHQYIGRPVDEGDDPIQVWMPQLRKAMRNAGKELAIINSEGGYGNPGTSITYRRCEGTTVPPDKMARWMVRQYVSQLAAGVRRFFFYNFFIDGSPVVRKWQGFVEGDGQPLPNVAAYATMTWLLDGASFRRTERPTNDVWVHRFATPQGALAVAWSRTDTSAALPFANARQAWDLMGVPLSIPVDKTFAITDAPIYVLVNE